MLTFMVFIFFCFSGLLAFMFHIFQTMEKQGRILRDDLAQVRVLLRALESRIDSQAVAQKATQAWNYQPANESHVSGMIAPALGGAVTADSLLHLSFDVPVQDAKQGVQDSHSFDPEFDLHIDSLPDSARDR